MTSEVETMDLATPSGASRTLMVQLGQRIERGQDRMRRAILAVPMMAALKIVCDHIESFTPIGEFLGT